VTCYSIEQEQKQLKAAANNPHSCFRETILILRHYISHRYSSHQIDSPSCVHRAGPRTATELRGRRRRPRALGGRRRRGMGCGAGRGGGTRTPARRGPGAPPAPARPAAPRAPRTAPPPLPPPPTYTGTWPFFLPFPADPPRRLGDGGEQESPTRERPRRISCLMVRAGRMDQRWRKNDRRELPFSFGDRAR
jgi:hypothetical protein